MTFLWMLGLALTQDDRSFLEPPQVVLAPGPEYRSESRKFQGIPSLARTAKGRLWASWYASKSGGEDRNNYVVAVSSDDDGRSWSAPRLAIDPDRGGPVRAFDPQLWQAPDGSFWIFWAQAIDHDGAVSGVWAMKAEDPDAPEPRWSAPRRLCDGIMMGKPLALASGEWLLPASKWKTERSATVVASGDAGATWALRGACHVPAELRAIDEHMLVERKDGSLWMLLRSGCGFILESVSRDRGATWSDAAPSPLKHPAARFFIRRLASGRLLLVKHHLTEGRKRLTALLSEDDGATWTPDGLVLDERGTTSYPDGVQAEDGRIFIVYDRNRNSDAEILMAVFTEEDARAGKPSESTRLRVLVDRGRGRP